MTREKIARMWRASDSDDPCDFMVDVVNAALEEAANKIVGENPDWDLEDAAATIRALKIGESK